MTITMRLNALLYPAKGVKIDRLIPLDLTRLRGERYSVYKTFATER